MLSNSVFAGLLASVYLTILLLHLNPSVPLTAHVPRTSPADADVIVGAAVVAVSKTTPCAFPERLFCVIFTFEFLTDMISGAPRSTLPGPITAVAP